MRKFIFGSLALAWAITIFTPAPPVNNPARAKTPTLAEAAALAKKQEKTMRLGAEAIRAMGYDCEKIEQVYPRIFSYGFDVYCHGGSGRLYKFSMEDHGGKWSVTAD
jgi:hypothetical protein